MVPILVWVASAVPLLMAFYFILYMGVGPDPGEWLMAYTGEWAIRLLLLVLAVTPLTQYLKYSPLKQARRPLGLVCFFYTSLHLITFSHFYMGWSLQLLAEEFIERPYITLGITSWCLLLPLAVSSNRRAVRYLGRHWKRLHRLVYVVAVFASLHFIWQARSDYGEPLVYACLFAVLLSWRLIHAWKKNVALKTVENSAF